MGSLTGCMGKAGELLRPADRQMLVDAALKQREAGLSRAEADKAAAQQVLEALKAEAPQETPKQAGVKWPGVLEQAGRQTETPEFKRWFGDSKVVDGEGKPLVVYHGTGGDFDVFRPGVARAIWFAADAGYAGKYVSALDGAENNVMPVHLSVQNPLIVDMKGGADLPRGLKGLLRYANSLEDVVGIAKQQGHDGVIFKNRARTVEGFASDEIAVFKPDQIKSAIGNRGTFDPNNPSILAQGERGQYEPRTATMSLLQGADLTTFLHESGHHFYELMHQFAMRPNAPEQIRNDFDTLLRSVGEQGATPEERLANWTARDLEGKRNGHEQIATQFERYLMEGKAPTQGLQPLFARFRSWLVNIYRSVAGTGAPDISPEVREVFNRLLASEEAIKETEQARGYMPLPREVFKDDAAYRAYMELGQEATDTAVSQMDQRSLRDMKWLSNARSRKLKELQAQAAAMRREARIEARRDILNEPTYQAWQFLTMRGDESGQAIPERRPSARGNVDPRTDSLLDAIAKLGGIDRESARRDLGIADDVLMAPADVVGRPAWRAKGGKTADGMREALEELGYLHQRDEFGRTDLQGLADAVSDELHGGRQYSWWASFHGDERPTGLDLDTTYHGKLNTEALRRMFGDAPDAPWRKLSKMGMTSDKRGVDPEAVALTFGFRDGRDMVETLAGAKRPDQAIEDWTDKLMLERHGEMVDPQSIENAANEAVHNEARARFMATGLKVLTDSPLPARELARAAKEAAEQMIAGKRIGDLQPSQYEATERRANRDALENAARDPAKAIEAQRAAVLNNRLARAAQDAMEEVRKGVKYLATIADSKTIDAEYRDQIEAMLEQYEFKPQTNKQLGRRENLRRFLDKLEEQGLKPDIPEGVIDDARQINYKELTVEEFRGIRDAVKALEHLGRLKNKLLLDKAGREFAEIRDTMVDSIVENAGDRQAVTREAATWGGKQLQRLRRVAWSHIKAAILARRLDGNKDGPVAEHLVNTANERANFETTQRHQATLKASEILAPLLKGGNLQKPRFFPQIGRSLTKEQVFFIAANMGNEGNIQRLLGGEGWRMDQARAIVSTLSADELRAVQRVWDHFEEFRPLIGEKERRVYGKEPEWVKPTPVEFTAADGTTVRLQGGYFPINYDRMATARAEAHADAESAKRQMQGAYTSATTRRGFTKTRMEEVTGRPLTYSASAYFSALNDVIHDLAWHEWLIDSNKLLRSDKIDGAIRERYGPEAVGQLKSWVNDIAVGERGMQAALDTISSVLRQGVSAAGLGFNIMSALLQPLGITQSAVRIGWKWVGQGLSDYITNPARATREVNDASEFMRNRSLTRFRELNELMGQIENQNPVKKAVGQYGYWLMMRFQQMVDVPTWRGAYTKALAEGYDEARAVSLADQSVIDAQGGGQIKDLSAIERGGPTQKLFTVFYSFMNTALNLGWLQTSSANTPAKKAKLLLDYTALMILPAIGQQLLKDAITPGDSGDYDDWESVAKKFVASEIDFLFGMTVVGREFSGAAKFAAGVEDRGRDYGGPAGFRLVTDVTQLGKQVGQVVQGGEFDDAFRKAVINASGDMFGLPSAQINRTITGIQALQEGETDNPAAVLFGYQKPR